ncbi:MAG TPA: glycosyl transferase [Thermoanaerobaculia bacterium]|jgi:UDP-GlcNAc:undecaprenyl-phosphate GlcNAc-1-phosphate transferase|nr:glycosyl transferase [Thermoanaerobaculia bacterium]
MMEHSFGAAAVRTAVFGLALCAMATPAVRALARRFGIVAAPKADRWHKTPTAMMGGVAIFLAVIATVLLFVPQTRASWAVLGASTLLFAVGLVDDFLHIKPYQKLIGQIIAAAIIINYGLVLPWTASPTFNMLVTFIWLIGLTNALNMLDNMDGLAAGTAALAAAFLGVNFFLNHQFNEAMTLEAFAGALLGFLLFNHNPASIFMGDCGSLFIGFFLASSALLSGAGGGRSRSLLAVLAVPVLVLFVPIFDTTFVTVMRKMAGRAASQGGRDHTSHRLVALGLSEKHAVWMLYACSIAAGSLALLARRASLDVSLAAIAGFVIVLTFLGIYLGRVRVYSEEEVAAARSKPLVAFLFDLSHKRRIFEVLLDVLLISGAYYLAYAIKFGPFDGSPNWQLFLQTLPLIVLVKLVAFLVTGIYRGLWKYASLSSVTDFARAVALGSLVAVLVIVFTFRFDGFSRGVFVLDALMLFMLVAASRFAFRILRRLFPVHAHGGKRVLIYGAGDGGELVYRELLNNPGLEYVPVAFADDDAAKTGRFIHGIPVYSTTTSFAEVRRRLQVEEVLISTAKIADDRLRAIVGECAAAGLIVRRACMSFEPLVPSDFGWVISDIPAAAPLVSRQGDVNLVHDHHLHVSTDH